MCTARALTIGGRGVYLPMGVYLPGGYLPRYSPPPWTEWQKGAKILPCPKLRWSFAGGKIAGIFLKMWFVHWGPTGDRTPDLRFTRPTPYHLATEPSVEAADDKIWQIIEGTLIAFITWIWWSIINYVLSGSSISFPLIKIR